MCYLCSPFFYKKTVYLFDVKIFVLFKRSKMAEYASFEGNKTGTPKQKINVS
jgi:hypothetical protein